MQVSPHSPGYLPSRCTSENKHNPTTRKIEKLRPTIFKAILGSSVGVGILTGIGIMFALTGPVGWIAGLATALALIAIAYLVDYMLERKQSSYMRATEPSLPLVESSPLLPPPLLETPPSFLKKAFQFEENQKPFLLENGTFNERKIIKQISRDWEGVKITLNGLQCDTLETLQQNLANMVGKTYEKLTDQEKNKVLAILCNCQQGGGAYLAWWTEMETQKGGASCTQDLTQVYQVNLTGNTLSNITFHYTLFYNVTSKENKKEKREGHLTYSTDPSVPTECIIPNPIDPHFPYRP